MRRQSAGGYNWRMPRSSLLATCALGACLALASDPAAAQQRPLVTEDPATVDNGFVLLEAGLTVLRDQPFPVSGLTGRFWSVPTLGISIGVGDRAEVQIDNVSFDRLRIAGREPAPLSHMLRVQGDTTGSWSDAVIGAKTRLVEERPWLPAIGLRFATKLPNASNEEGLGLDTVDFYQSLLLGKTIRSVRVAGNVGLGILSDPTRGDRQNDVLTYGLSAVVPVGRGVEVVGEWAGRANTRRRTAPPGTDSAGQVRAGGRITRGTFRFDAALLAGVTSRDADLGVTAGVTWGFQALDRP